MPQFRPFAKDRVLKSLVLVVLALAIPCYKSIEHPNLSILYPALSYGLIFIALQWTFRALLTPLGRNLIARRPSWSREVWVAKVDRFTAAIYKFTCTVYASVTLYRLLRDKPWFSRALGGSGDTIACWTTETHTDPELLKFFISSIGFLIADLVVLIAKENKRPDFAELILHLTVTVALLIFSVLGGFIRITSLAISAHIICDLFVYAAKALVDTRLSGGAFAYLPLLLVHVWFRLYVFSSTILKSALVEAPKFIEKTPAWGFVSGMLGMSLLLHAYWGFVIVKIGLLLLSTGQNRDLQANLSAIDLQAKRGE